MVWIAYCILAVVFALLIFRPRVGLLAAIGAKPVIDMFWWAKSSGSAGFHVESPTHLAAVGVPILAFIGLKWVDKVRCVTKEDFVLIGFLSMKVIIAFIQLSYLDTDFSNILGQSRTLFIFAFFWLGKYYFQTPLYRKWLLIVLLCRSALPMGLSILMDLSGGQMTMAQVNNFGGFDLQDNLYSGFYLEARHGIQRLSGFYEGVYELAFLGCFGVLVAFACLQSPDFRWKKWAVLSLFVSGYCLIYTFSRSAWIVFLIALVSFFWAKRQYRDVLLAVVATVVVYLSSEVVQYRFEDELGAVTGASEFSRFGFGRGSVWLLLVEKFTELPIMDQMFGSFLGINPENQFLGALLFNGYVGFVGFVLFLLFFSASLIGCMKVLPRSKELDTSAMVMFGCLIVVTYWFGGLGNNFIAQVSEQWVLWLWAGILVAERERVRVEGSKRKWHKIRSLPTSKFKPLPSLVGNYETGSAKP